MSKVNKKREYENLQLHSFEQFIQSEDIEEHEKVPVHQIEFSRRIKVAFWFLRVYIAIMVVIVIIGFIH